MTCLPNIYLGFTQTTSIIISQGIPVALRYVSGNGQMSTCTTTLKNPFIVKVVDQYENPCNGVAVNWEIASYPVGATGQFVSPTNTITNSQGIATASLTLGTEPPGTYTIYGSSAGLAGSPCTFTVRAVRRFGNITGFCLLNLGTGTIGTTTDITVTIVGIGTTTMTDANSYFIFQNIPVGSYTLTFDTWGASPATKTNVYISLSQVEDTTYIGTISLLAGDTNNDGKVNTVDWSKLVNAFGDSEGSLNWNQNKEGDFNHDKQVNMLDFAVFRNNFGKQQQVYRSNAPRLSPKLDRVKAEETTSGGIKLSFDLDTLEGVNVDELRVGNIIYLKIHISNAENFLGGEVHLSFNPSVLQVVDAEGKETNQIQQGNFPQGLPSQPPVYLMNEVDNLLGKIDYAVVVWQPEKIEDGSLLVKVAFRVISSGNSSKVGFDFDEEENRQTMFTERIGSTDQSPKVTSDELIINVPKIFNNLDSALVYPNPAYKGDTIVFDNLISGKLISLKIFNIAGELIFEDEKIPNDNKITWDLRNNDKEYVASGTYIYFLTDHAGLTKKGKIGVVR